jgi:hypothetical protein
MHLRKQLLALEGNDDQAAAAISGIVNEEQQHFDLSASHLGQRLYGRLPDRK